MKILPDQIEIVHNHAPGNFTFNLWSPGNLPLHSLSEKVTSLTHVHDHLGILSARLTILPVHLYILLAHLDISSTNLRTLYMNNLPAHLEILPA